RWSVSTPDGSTGDLLSLKVEGASALLGGEAVDDPEHPLDRLVGRDGRRAAAHARLHPARMEPDGAEALGAEILGQQLRHHVQGGLARPVRIPAPARLGDASELAGEVDDPLALSLAKAR